jgi:hypothetical protein
MRDLNPAAKTAIAQGRAKLELLVFLDLSTPLRLTTCMESIVWGGYTWLSTRGMGSVDPIKDDGDNLSGITFSLNGAQVDNLASVLTEKARGRACHLYVAVLDVATEAVLDALLQSRLVLDQCGVSDSAPDDSGVVSSTISVSARHLGTLFQRSKPLYYTDADQQKLYPGDYCLEFLNDQTSTEVVWPAAEFFRV